MKKSGKSIQCRLLTAWMILTCAALHSPAQTQTEPAQQPKPEIIGLAPCIASGVVIGIAIAGCWIMIKMCKKVPPPSPPPGAPPAVPPPSTNAPATNHIASLSPPDPGTNGPPGSNSGPFRAFYWVPPSWVAANIAVTNTISEGEYIDVSSLGYTDTNGPTVAPVFGFVTATISNLQSSVDLVTWSNYTLDMWASTNGLVTVLYDGSRAPVRTNYAAGNPTTGSGPTNQIPFGIWITGDGEPKKFFRVVSNP